MNTIKYLHSQCSGVCSLAIPGAPETRCVERCVKAEHAFKRQPHAFAGRLDRWCEKCNLPYRNPIHKVRLS